MVFYPVIHNIHTCHYEVDPKQGSVVPDNLRCISWMDGCHGQLKLTTQDDVLKTEEKLKITTNKHNAACTAVEQAADVGPMFLICRNMIKSIPSETKATSPLFNRLTKALHKLEHPEDPKSSRKVVLPLHKKKSIIAGLSKLPTAMSNAFQAKHIKSAFVYNGQIDEKYGTIPSVKTFNWYLQG